LIEVKNEYANDWIDPMNPMVYGQDNLENADIGSLAINYLKLKVG